MFAAAKDEATDKFILTVRRVHPAKYCYKIEDGVIIKYFINFPSMAKAKACADMLNRDFLAAYEANWMKADATFIGKDRGLANELEKAMVEAIEKHGASIERVGEYVNDKV